MRALALIPLLLLLAGPTPAARADAEIAIVVARDGPVPRLSGPLDRRRLARVFRGQIKVGRDGQRLHPVNLPARHPLRVAFSRALFHRSPEEMAQYWNEQYFQGNTPPHVVASEEAMLRFVARTPGAIGYVAACHVDDRVRVILRLRVRAPRLAALCRGD